MKATSTFSPAGFRSRWKHNQPNTQATERMERCWAGWHVELYEGERGGPRRPRKATTRLRSATLHYSAGPHSSYVIWPGATAAASQRQEADKMKIDSYTHFACPAFMDHLEAESGHPMVFRGLFSAIPELSNVDRRIRQVKMNDTHLGMYMCMIHTRSMCLYDHDMLCTKSTMCNRTPKRVP